MHTNAGIFEEQKLEKSYDVKLLWRIYPFVKPYRRLLTFSIVMAMVITLLDLSLPYITKIAIDRYIVPKSGMETAPAGSLTINLSRRDFSEIVRRYPEAFAVSGSSAVIAYNQMDKLAPPDLKTLRQDDLAGISLIAVIFLGIVVLDFLLNFSQQMIMEYTGQKIMHDFRMKLFTHIQEMPVSYFNQNPVARLVTRTTSDVQNMQEMFTSIIAFVFKDMFLLCGIAAVLKHVLEHKGND